MFALGTITLHANRDSAFMKIEVNNFLRERLSVQNPA